jgi:hypothetical protein
MGCIKPRFNTYWETAKETLPEKLCITMSQDHVQACRAKETDEFKAEIESVQDEMHQKVLTEWKASHQVPDESAEDYHK